MVSHLCGAVLGHLPQMQEICGLISLSLFNLVTYYKFSLCYFISFCVSISLFMVSHLCGAVLGHLPQMQEICGSIPLSSFKLVNKNFPLVTLYNFFFFSCFDLSDFMMYHWRVFRRLPRELEIRGSIPAFHS